MELFRKIYQVPNHDFKGQIVGTYLFKDNITKVLVTQEKTINRNIIKINLYFRGKKEFSTRFNKRTFSKYNLEDMLKHFWFSRNLSHVKPI